MISVRLREPQFEGQTKAKLGNVSIRSLVERATNEKLASWLEENPPEARKVVQKSVIASRARAAAKEARDLTRRKSALEGAGMPDKLRDCASGTAAEDAELFIIEGDSAGGTAVQARDPATQAILPIRGKFLNVEKARLDKMMQEPRGAGAHRRDRLRRRQRRVRGREGALPQGHHHGRRGCRRIAHPHAAADVLLPSDEAVDRRRLRLHRAAAAVLDDRRQGEDLPQGRHTRRTRSSRRTRTTSTSSTG